MNEVRIRLLRDHIVNARTIKAGMVVNLPPASAAFLIELKVGEPLDAPPVPVAAIPIAPPVASEPAPTDVPAEPVTEAGPAPEPKPQPRTRTRSYAQHHHPRPH